MIKLLAGVLVFAAGFAVMVLEIAGARFLARDFGSSLYVWTSQIGVVLAGLALGYAVGGALADRLRSACVVPGLLALAGGECILIPNFTPALLRGIVMRHPLGEPIPLLWQKLDPVLGSLLVFLLPCFILAIVSPYMIRLSSVRLEQVGRISGLIYASGTLGSIAGVFVSGYVMVDLWSLPAIFRVTGVFILLLAPLCYGLQRYWGAKAG